MKHTKKKLKLPKPKQFEDMKKWLSFYESHGKLPYIEIYCCECKMQRASMSPQKVKKLLIGSNISTILTTTNCKMCVKFEKDRIKEIVKKEKKENEVYLPKIVNIMTREEMDIRADEIRKNLPVIDLHKKTVIIDLSKNREACEKETKSNCIRPDIFLKNRDCDDCSLNVFCKCPIKKFSKYYKSK